MPSAAGRGKGCRCRARQLGRPARARRAAALPAPVARRPPIGTWLLLIPCWWGLLLAAAADPAASAFRPLDRRRLRGRRVADARRRLHLERPDRPGHRRRGGAHPLAAAALGPGDAAAGRGLDGGAGARRLRHPPQLPAAGDRCSASARWRWSRSIPSPSASPGGRRCSSASPSTGACCSAWAAHARRPRRGAAAALRRRHRLDAVLRHDLRPPGPRGRRADRRAARPRGCSAPRTGAWLAGFLAAAAALAALACSPPRRRPGAGGRARRRRRLRGASRLAAPPARHRRRRALPRRSSAPTATPG